MLSVREIDRQNRKHYLNTGIIHRHLAVKSRSEYSRNSTFARRAINGLRANVEIKMLILL